MSDTITAGTADFRKSAFARRSMADEKAFANPEDQTMNMAKSVAKLLSENLRYPNGEPVECVIADTCIGGVAEAAAARTNSRKKASAYR